MTGLICVLCIRVLFVLHQICLVIYTCIQILQYVSNNSKSINHQYQFVVRSWAKNEDYAYCQLILHTLMQCYENVLEVDFCPLA